MQLNIFLILSPPGYCAWDPGPWGGRMAGSPDNGLQDSAEPRGGLVDCKIKKKRESVFFSSNKVGPDTLERPF